MVNTGKNNSRGSPVPSSQLRLGLRNGPEGEGAESLPPWSREVARLPPYKGRTSRCQLAKNWGLRPRLTTWTSQMSSPRKEGCSNRQGPKEHRLGVQKGSVLTSRWPWLPRPRET